MERNESLKWHEFAIGCGRQSDSLCTTGWLWAVLFEVHIPLWKIWGSLWGGMWIYMDLNFVELVGLLNSGISIINTRGGSRYGPIRPWPLFWQPNYANSALFRAISAIWPPLFYKFRYLAPSFHKSCIRSWILLTLLGQIYYKGHRVFTRKSQKDFSSWVTTPTVKNCYKIFCRGCMDLKWNSPNLFQVIVSCMVVMSGGRKC